MRVAEISTADTYPLRLAVLRENTPTTDVTFPEDDWPGTVHLGVLDAANLVVATSSWVRRDCSDYPDERGVQLLRLCYGQLKDAEQKIQQLSGVNEDGTPQLQPFEHTASVSKKK